MGLRHIYSLTYMCEIFKKKIRLVKYREQTGSCKRSGGGREEWVSEMGKGVRRNKLPGIK